MPLGQKDEMLQNTCNMEDNHLSTNPLGLAFLTITLYSLKLSTNAFLINSIYIDYFSHKYILSNVPSFIYIISSPIRKRI